MTLTELHVRLRSIAVVAVAYVVIRVRNCETRRTAHAGQAAMGLAIIALVLFALQSTATAAVQISAPGSVTVLVQAKDGSPVKGAEITLKLPNADGKLFAGSDSNVTKTDGGDDDDLGKMAKKAADGDVEFAKASLLGNIADGNEYQIIAKLDGAATIRITTTYDANESNSATVKFARLATQPVSEEKQSKAVKPKSGDIVIVMNDAEGNPLKGATVELTLPGKSKKSKTDAEKYVSVVTDGTKKDADGLLNGKVLFAKNDVSKHINNKGKFSAVILSESILKAEDGSPLVKNNVYKESSVNIMTFARPERVPEEEDVDTQEGEAETEK